MLNSDETYARNCPGCATSFTAVTDCGVCPTCKLFSRVDRNGKLIVLIDAEYMGNLPNDDPNADGPLATLFENLEYGGGPIVTTARYDGTPSVDHVQQELLLRFQVVREQLTQEIPAIDYTTIDDPESHPDWIGSQFSESECLHVLTWHAGGMRFDIVCELTSDGGAIHAIPPDAEYHLQQDDQRFP